MSSKNKNEIKRPIKWNEKMIFNITWKRTRGRNFEVGARGKKKQRKEKTMDGRRIERRTFRKPCDHAKRTLYHWVTRPIVGDRSSLIAFYRNTLGLGYSERLLNSHSSVYNDKTVTSDQSELIWNESYTPPNLWLLHTVLRGHQYKVRSPQGRIYTRRTEYTV